VTAAEHRPAAAPAGRPHLAVITTCGCGAATTKVVDRDGTPVVFDAGPDGKAVRDPYGGWWIAKYKGRWTVVKPAEGEDPPESGGGVRLREHDCAGPEVALLKAVFGAEVIAVGTEAAVAAGAAMGAMPPPKPAELVAEHGFRRPAGRGEGLRGPVCVERLHLAQASDPWGPPFPVLCVRCSRITNRVDLDAMGWCGGEPAGRELGPPWWPSKS
jgi:hypothetical protein